MKRGLILVYTLFYFCSSAESAEKTANVKTLRLIQTLCRHGDRNPHASFPTDVNNGESTWKGGIEELTTLGIQQEYEVGQFLKRRYNGFLSNGYDYSEVYARSSAFNRTIASALAILAGLYPPREDQVWNKNLAWLPIPVHSKPRHDDPVIWMHRPCPKADESYRRLILSSPEYQAIENANKDFLDFVRIKTDRKSVHLLDMWEVYDPLFCEYIYKDTHKWPEWVNETVYKRIEELRNLSVPFYYSRPEIQRFRGSLLFREVASRIMDKIKGTAQYVRRLKHYLYSLHDTTQISVLENLGAFDGISPTYAQVLILELHEREGKFFVELYKRNTTNTDDVIPVTMAACGSPCLAEKLFEVCLTKTPSPRQWYRECGFTKGTGREGDKAAYP